ncbi:MAG: formyltransferase family protein [Paracoccaceae bacterium]
MLSDDKVLFIGDGSGWSFLAATQLRRICPKIETVFWDYGTPQPTSHVGWIGDHIFTFKADLLLSDAVLSKTRKTAINFHPAPPLYRGVGGYHFALADGQRKFGATCHYIDTQIDHGQIIAVDRFPIYEEETTESLMDRTAHVCLGLFYRIIDRLDKTGALELAQNEAWGSHLYTRKQLARSIKSTRKSKQLSTA